MSHCIPSLLDKIFLDRYVRIDMIIPFGIDIQNDRSYHKDGSTAQFDDMDTEAHLDEDHGNDCIGYRLGNVKSQDDVLPLIRINDHLISQSEIILGKC